MQTDLFVWQTCDFECAEGYQKVAVGHEGWGKALMT